jgi:hypothetical protein
VCFEYRRLPTLFLCECVLIYLEASEAAAVLATAAAMAAEAGAPAAVAIYEQTRPDDAFGSTMISNLEVCGLGWPNPLEAEKLQPVSMQRKTPSATRRMDSMIDLEADHGPGVLHV